MPAKRHRDRAASELRYEEIADADFQQRWLAARDLEWEQVEAAFRHGFDSRGRFADRPFHEVEAYLRESWDGMRNGVRWDHVWDIVRSGYERYKGAGVGSATDPGPEALDRFLQRTIGGSTVGGGTMGDVSFRGAAEPVSEFEGEGGPPVGGQAGEEDGGRLSRSED